MDYMVTVSVSVKERDTWRSVVEVSNSETGPMTPAMALSVAKSITGELLDKTEIKLAKEENNANCL